MAGVLIRITETESGLAESIEVGFGKRQEGGWNVTISDGTVVGWVIYSETCSENEQAWRSGFGDADNEVGRGESRINAVRMLLEYRLARLSDTSPRVPESDPTAERPPTPRRGSRPRST